MTSADPHAQSRYQVRLDWGAAGAAAIAPDAQVVVWVDVLGDAEVPLATLPASALVLTGGFTDAAAVAARVLEEQERLGERAHVAVIAAGDRRGDELRFCVEDLLAAGAVVDALAAVGLDYSSPEAAAACAAFTGLRGAVGHLATASGSAQELLAAGVDRAVIRARSALDATSAVTVLRTVA